MTDSKMHEYKNTLNLPQTDFPMKANLPQREPQILKRWEESHLYEKICIAGKNRPKFILHLGPPYANGHIHLGTATTTLLKDIIVKSKLMSGFNSPLVPGWDCHGLPIELNVEKKHGKPGRNISVSEFRKACREYAASQINIQREEFKRLGIIADWDHPYITMDFRYEANIIRSLAKIVANNHVEKGYKPVHWCLDCSSALAEAEVEYADKKSPSIDVRFVVIDNADFLKRFKDKTITTQKTISVPIWTTTPWTLPASQAIALNPLLQYALIETDKELLLIAEDLIETVMQSYHIEKYTKIASAPGEAFLGIQLQHPFADRNEPIIVGDHVNLEAGTGAVHTAPAHGPDDYLMGKKFNLPLDNPIGDDGCYVSSTPLVAGMHVNKVKDIIIGELEKRGMLLTNTTITHSYPHCWRHKTAIIFRATPQWFISMDKNGLRAKALAAIERVKWIPDWGQARIAGMIETRPDWCISRQRVWGVPIPLFIHKDTGELHPNTIELMEKVAQRVEAEGAEAWFTLDSTELLGDEASQYQKTNDILDVWFDSGVSHECVLRQRPELTFPADIVLEGSDQHRGWFQSSLLTSLAINNEESYKQVLTHGFVVDGQGRKMSKSIGNVIAPEEVVTTLGADILRLWVASVDYRTEITASKEILARMSEAYRRIRNTARFLLANLHGFDPEKNLLPPHEMLMLDRWAVDKTGAIQNEILESYNTYQFHQVVQKIHNFCVTDMGGFYLDIIKDRQYTMQQDSRGRRSAQTAMYHIVNALTRWMAPIMSFTAEEIWAAIPGQNQASVFLSTWYEQLVSLPKDDVMNHEFWDKVHAVRDAVNKEIENQRNAGVVGSSLEAEVNLYCGPNLKSILDVLENELRFVLITSSARVIPEHSGPVDMVVTDVAGLGLKVSASPYPKCERCWHRCASVDQDPNYPGICQRCVENVAGSGEIREYA